jgi:aldose 1-epimerase
MSPRTLLRAHGFELELAPEVGGAIAAFRRRGQPIMRESPRDLDDALESASFPLVPYCNRVRGGRFVFRGREVRLSTNLKGDPSPLHGQGWRSPWTVTRAEGGVAELAFDHPAGEWPWAYEARQRLEIVPDGLICGVTVRNVSADPMPAGLGLHPYFPCGPDTVLDTGVATVLAVDGDVLPTEELPATGRYELRDRRIDGAGLDNGFGGWSGRARLAWPDRKLALEITSEARFLQVYAPPQGGVVVVEPVGHANDVFSHPESEWARLGMHVLDPGRTLGLEARFVVSDLR